MSDVIKRTGWEQDATDPQIMDPGELGPVLEEEVIEALSKARTLIERAKTEATRIRARAKDLLSTVAMEKEEERKRGYAQGLEQGKGEWTQKVVEVKAHHEAILKEAEPQVIQMVIESVEKVLGKEIKKGAVTDVIRSAIGKAVGKKIVLHVSPGDYLTVQEKIKEITSELDATQSFVLKEADEITPGGCVVETELGTIDARLEVQLAAIRRALGLE